MDSTTAYVLSVVFVATLIRTVFGFGEALVAVPLLALRIPVQVAAPLAVVLSVTVAGVVVARDWRSIQLRSAAGLILSSIVGIPLGVWLLTAVDERLVKSILAIVIIAFSVYALLGHLSVELKRYRAVWLVACGFSAGVLGGAYGMNGPPLVLYGSLRKWSAQQFRATLQGYFLPCSLLGLAGYRAAGLWSAAVTRYFLASLPCVLIAIVLGQLVNRRLHGQAFLRAVYVGLMVVGGTLLFQALPR